MAPPTESAPSLSRCPLSRSYLRQEPDALTSARPGPSGGCQVTGIPTGIANWEREPGLRFTHPKKIFETFVPESSYLSNAQYAATNGCSANINGRESTFAMVGELAP